MKPFHVVPHPSTAYVVMSMLTSKSAFPGQTGYICCLLDIRKNDSIDEEHGLLDILMIYIYSFCM
jgi:hypothetical protein